VGDEGGRVVQRLGGKVRGQDVAYGFGGGAAFEPGGDGRGESAYVTFREQEAGVVAVEGSEEGGGPPVGLQVVDLGFGEGRAGWLGGCGGLIGFGCPGAHWGRWGFRGRWRFGD
jgi:hypothetical protein